MWHAFSSHIPGQSLLHGADLFTARGCCACTAPLVWCPMSLPAGYRVLGAESHFHSAQCDLGDCRRLSTPRARQAKAMPRCQSFNDLTASEPTAAPQEPLFEMPQDGADGSSQAQPRELIGSVSASAAELLQAAAAASHRTSRWAVALLPVMS